MTAIFSIGLPAVITAICLYLAFTAFRAQDPSIWMFLGFGLLSGVFLAAGLLRRLKPGRQAETGRQGVSFVPHRFFMAALIIAGLLILAALLIPRMLR